jgi:UDP-N-acetylmuramate dehydrogenase
MSDPRPAPAGYTLTAQASLERHTTFRVPARAAWLAELMDDAVVPEILARPELEDLPVLALGEGSNILFTRDFEGLVLKFANAGIEVLTNGDVSRVRVAAGENWDAFVRWSLSQGLSGLENLILIPGSVGAAPIQNIGAYGAEVREFIVSVAAWDNQQSESVVLDNAACRFSYRDSVFKQEPGRYFITSVEFDLPRAHPLRLDYSGVREELAAQGIVAPRSADVAKAVETLRRRKLPDPAIIGNAGSFFKNPLIATERAEALRRAFPGLPLYNSSAGNSKISAAWLIESCGFKGVRDGDTGVSDKHSLVLVNYGHATGVQILALATRIRDAVAARYGITLEPEPLIL